MTQAVSDVRHSANISRQPIRLIIDGPSSRLDAPCRCKVAGLLPRCVGLSPCLLMRQRSNHRAAASRAPAACVATPRVPAA